MDALLAGLIFLLFVAVFFLGPTLFWERQERKYREDFERRYGFKPFSSKKDH